MFEQQFLFSAFPEIGEIVGVAPQADIKLVRGNYLVQLSQDPGGRLMRRQEMVPRALQTQKILNLCSHPWRLLGGWPFFSARSEQILSCVAVSDYV